MSEVTGVDTQIAALDWFLNPEDKTPRLSELLANPTVIGPTIVGLVTKLDRLAVHAHGITGTYRSEVIKNKWEFLHHLVDQSAHRLETGELFLYVGGSLLYQDPSEDPDYDLVAFSLEPSATAEATAQELENQLYEIDPSAGMVDLVYVDFARFRELAARFSRGKLDKNPHGFSRSSLHYLNHILTGYPLYIPPKFSRQTPDYLRRHLLLDYYQKIPILGALCVLDLQQVLLLREARAKLQSHS